MTKDVIEEFQEDLDKASRRGKLREKVEDHRLRTQVEKIDRDEQRRDRVRGLQLSNVFNESYCQQMDRAQDVRAASFEKRMPFINPTLSQLVNLAAQELIFVGGKSGRGKSTAIANIVTPLIINKPVRKILIISNEEMAVAIYNRITCHLRGWNINDLKRFTPEQHAELKRMRRILTQVVHVVDQDFPGVEGAVFNVDNIQDIFEKALTEGYDLILFDYYQKCGQADDPRATKVQNLTRLSEYLDSYVKRSPAPVVIMGQLKTEAKDRVEFEDRIKESKSIFVNCTQAVEMVTDRDKLKTIFIKRKDRWDQRDNLAVEAGFDRGRYVEYTEEFQAKVAHGQIMAAQRAEAEDALKGVGV
jgi:hypothetical protein